MFLSKMLTDIERRYQLTELETYTVIQSIKKVKYIVDAVVSIIVFTNYSIVTIINNYTTITKTNVTGRRNPYLEAIGIFLLEFLNLRIVYRPSIYQLVFDVISQLVNKRNSNIKLANSNNNSLNKVAVPIYYTILVKISNNFKSQIVDSYKIDKVQYRIIRVYKAEKTA